MEPTKRCLALKSVQRNESYARLLSKKEIIEVTVEGMLYPMYMRSIDQPILNQALAYEPIEQRASILAPLDNLLWDRVLIKQLFDFEYRWEVYKPVSIRKYGYYVLPVLYGDQIVARFEPVKHKKNMPLMIKNWWWEDHITVTKPMQESIRKCLERFAGFLGTVVQEEPYEFLTSEAVIIE